MTAVLVPIESIRTSAVPNSGIGADNLGAQLSSLLHETRVLTRMIDRIAFASDASLYRLIPRAVVQPMNSEEVRRLFQFSRERKIPLTFRAGGTSLCGQAITDGILVDVGRYWRTGAVEDSGRLVRVQPGLIGQQANQMLKPYAAKIGPDPASISAARMGGILSNNASGMCCGVSQNAYHTLRSMTFVLPSGTEIDTAAPDARRAISRERAAPRRRPAAVEAADRSESRIVRAHSLEVSDEEHDRIFAQCVSGLFRSRRDLQPPTDWF